MAKRQPTRRSAASRPQGTADDVFVARVFEFSTWARKNSQLLVLAGVAAALVLAGGIYYMSHRSELARQAVTELERVQQTATFLPDEAEGELRRYLDQYGGTRYAAEARLLLGQILLSQGRPQEAVLALEAGAGSGRDPMVLSTRLLLGRAYEELGRFADAESQFLSVADRAPLEFQQRDALADAARARALSGNHTGAAELYRRILSGLDEGHQERGYYQMRLAEMELQARG